MASSCWRCPDRWISARRGARLRHLLAGEQCAQEGIERELKRTWPGPLTGFAPYSVGSAQEGHERLTKRRTHPLLNGSDQRNQLVVGAHLSLSERFAHDAAEDVPRKESGEVHVVLPLDRYGQ